MTGVLKAGRGTVKR